MKNDPSLIGLLPEISAEEAAAHFDLLQRRLEPLWRSIESFNQDEQTIVVVPSISLEMAMTGFEIQGSGQSYLGCIFPADPAYASTITRDAAKVGDLLRDAGVIGRFALDFVVTRADEQAAWESYAIEINLRKGGTTHPFLTLQPRAIISSRRSIAVTRRTTFSIWWCGAGYISGRRARPGSSFTCSALSAARAALA